MAEGSGPCRRGVRGAGCERPPPTPTARLRGEECRAGFDVSEGGSRKGRALEPPRLGCPG